MRKFETKSVFANGKWDEIYFVDGENVTEEEYFGAMESEELDEEYENANDDEECECEECDCMECTVSDYVCRILETEGCPNCIENILKDFVVNIASRFIKEEE